MQEVYRNQIKEKLKTKNVCSQFHYDCRLGDFSVVEKLTPHGFLAQLEWKAQKCKGFIEESGIEGFEKIGSDEVVIQNWQPNWLRSYWNLFRSEC